MLVNLYKTKTPLAVFSFPILMGVFALPVLFFQYSDDSAFFSWQFNLSVLISSSSIINYFTTALLLFVGGIELNRLVNAYGFYSKNTYLPGLIYALALATFDQLFFSSALIAYTFLIYAMGYLFRINRQDSAIESVFMASFFIGVATVFSPFLAPIVILPWFSLVVFRYFVWREWFMLLLGLSIPWGLHYGIHFAVSGRVNLMTNGFTLVNHPVEFSIQRATILSFVGLLTIYSSWKYLVILNTQLLAFKKRSRLIFHFVWLAILTIFLGWYFQDFLIIAISIPLTIITSVQILNATHSLYSNLMLTTWIGLIVWNFIM